MPLPNFTRFKTRHCGDAITFHYESVGRVHIIFVNTGHITHTQASTVRSKTPPNIKDPYSPIVFGVGFDGVGQHATYEQGLETRTHGIWRAMFRRCYGDEWRPAYWGCTVCPEWHNFQTFATWYKEAGGREGMELDKDIKVTGNRVYSPDACMIVTQAENLAARVMSHATPRPRVHHATPRPSAHPPLPTGGYDYMAQRERHSRVVSP